MSAQRKSFPLAYAWLSNMETCNEALVLVMDRYRHERWGIPSVFEPDRVSRTVSRKPYST